MTAKPHHAHTLAAAPAIALASALSALQPSPSALCSDTPPARPNILYILVDDMGYADCGFNGGKDIRTPNIDALSRLGATFENYYVQHLCSATRCTLLTGRMPNHHGIYGALKNDTPSGLPLDERILPQLLKTAGYTTAITGKWHIGEYKPEYRPMHRGWDHQYGLWLGQLDYFTHKSGARPDWYRDDQPLAETGYTTNLIGNEAIRLIKAQPNDKPLFLYIPFNAVHGPFMAPPEAEKPYASLSPARRTYAAMLAVTDDTIGQVCAALRETGKASNTIIIFSSDNGGVQPGIRADNTPLRDGKGSIYEGGVRSSAFIIWPGKIKPGAKITPPVHIADWYPTLAALTGADLATQKKNLDGQNILPLLLEGKPPPRDALLLVGTTQRYALRMGDWKILINPAGPPPKGHRVDPDAAYDNELIAKARIELYNLATDISEQHDLSAAEPDRLKTMLSRARQMMSGASPPKDLPATTPNPKGKKAKQ